ncbi:hypothetical protein IFR05_015942 [Cadophora sp. M221]|nr:hypothetical protein IFR05_015942 [Cadophora sp. M221]
MSGNPPPYEEVAAENPALLEPSPTLVVHLQVWHYRSEGRSSANNDELAALFRNHNLQNWEVVPLEVDGITDLSSHDQYVPVEVIESLPLTFGQFPTQSCIKNPSSHGGPLGPVALVAFYRGAVVFFKQSD